MNFTRLLFSIILTVLAHQLVIIHALVSVVTTPSPITCPSSPAASSSPVLADRPLDVGFVPGRRREVDRDICHRAEEMEMKQRPPIACVEASLCRLRSTTPAQMPAAMGVSSRLSRDVVGVEMSCGRWCVGCQAAGWSGVDLFIGSQTPSASGRGVPGSVGSQNVCGVLRSVTGPLTRQRSTSEQESD
ncbi:hypothetical protein M409DRAFT_61775 [Zasmidium cellare ATCC 36951]|uniref:Secreted protein n=1 Tax=Zasmidium cellare ATCC 36951 TaxID=1080233 RepID=A0A6A6BY21_ZASCE|nr:uncharacterized protein M409DRAFT_61775 [Zasmidium cellare ATCC 36951]KAF2158306.1 hypothetical protein M409DRAFT_61775 [Zasmidium cellare ATCC 36951]